MHPIIRGYFKDLKCLKTFYHSLVIPYMLLESPSLITEMAIEKETDRIGIILIIIKGNPLNYIVKYTVLLNSSPWLDLYGTVCPESEQVLSAAQWSLNQPPYLGFGSST